MPVEVLAAPEERLASPVEAAAYFAVSEALANVAKYAQATRVTVEVAVRGNVLVAEVRDDGVGGADLQAGSGLRGLADRMSALDGALEVQSPPGEGTLVRATVPLGWSPSRTSPCPSTATSSTSARPRWWPAAPPAWPRGPRGRRGDHRGDRGPDLGPDEPRLLLADLDRGRLGTALLAVHAWFVFRRGPITEAAVQAELAGRP